MNGSVRHLALPITWLAPELTRMDVGEEKGSDCANCPMAGRPFLMDVRCCTYEPWLPNFLVGRALRRGDNGSERIRLRMEHPEGVSTRGIQPRQAFIDAYREHRDTDFGRNREWACPYWTPGPLSCSIWKDRNAVCRTWHCKPDAGVPGHGMWNAVRNLIDHLERELQTLCESQVATPAADAQPADWEAYFIRCAEHVEQLSAGDLLALPQEPIDELRATLRERLGALHPELPDVLAPQVTEVTPVDGGVELEGYSPFHTARFPSSIFLLLSKMDGETPWAVALEQAVAEDEQVKSSWIPELFRLGLLRSVEEVGGAWGDDGPEIDLARLEEELQALRAKSTATVRRVME